METAQFYKVYELVLEAYGKPNSLVRVAIASSEKSLLEWYDTHCCAPYENTVIDSFGDTVIRTSYHAPKGPLYMYRPIVHEAYPKDGVYYTCGALEKSIKEHWVDKVQLDHIVTSELWIG